MKILIKILSVLAMIVAFSKSTSAMESLNNALLENLHTQSSTSATENKTLNIETTVEKFFNFCNEVEEKLKTLIRNNPNIFTSKDFSLFEKHSYSPNYVAHDLNELISNTKKAIKAIIDKNKNPVKINYDTYSNLISEIEKNSRCLTKKLFDLEYLVTMTRLSISLTDKFENNTNNALSQTIEDLINFPNYEYDSLLQLINTLIKNIPTVDEQNNNSYLLNKLKELTNEIKNNLKQYSKQKLKIINICNGKAENPKQKKSFCEYSIEAEVDNIKLVKQTLTELLINFVY